jgi:hypothetical protein
VIGDQPNLLNSPQDLIHAVKAKLMLIIVGVVALTIAYFVMVYFRGRAGKK